MKGFVKFLEPDIGIVAGLIALVILLAYVQIRNKALAEPIYRCFGYRLLLAAIAGWLTTTVFYADVLPGFNNVSIYLSGAVFAALVMLPMLKDPARHPGRVAILIWAGAAGHAAIWATGLTIYDRFSTLSLTAIGVPAGLVFGTVVAVAASRAGLVRFGWMGVLAIIATSGTCGFLYAAAMLEDWPKSIPTELATYLSYVIWWVALSALFAFGEPRRLVRKMLPDYLSLIGLSLLSVWSVAVLAGN